MHGNETYTIHQHEYNLPSGSYLLCNAHSEGSVRVDSKKPVRGICIDLLPALLSEVVASYREPDTSKSDLSLDLFFNSSDFMEQQFHAESTALGVLLYQLDGILDKNPYDNYQFTNEFYYQLAEGIVCDYIPVVKKLQSVRGIKAVTRRELLKKLETGKKFIEMHFCENIHVEQIAQESGISQYHFFRLFKSVYGVSPYQYIKIKKLEMAREMILKNDCPVSLVALDAGYSDLFSFSKAYKKHFGVAPSAHADGC